MKQRKGLAGIKYTVTETPGIKYTVPETQRAIIDLAYDEYLATGVDISPLVMSVDEYERQKRIGIPLIAEIERDMARL